MTGQLINNQFTHIHDRIERETLATVNIIINIQFSFFYKILPSIISFNFSTLLLKKMHEDDPKYLDEERTFNSNKEENICVCSIVFIIK